MKLERYYCLVCVILVVFTHICATLNMDHGGDDTLLQQLRAHFISDMFNLHFPYILN